MNKALGVGGRGGADRGNLTMDLGKQLSFLALTRGSRRIEGTAKAISLHKREWPQLKAQSLRFQN